MVSEGQKERVLWALLELPSPPGFTQAPLELPGPPGATWPSCGTQPLGQLLGLPCFWLHHRELPHPDSTAAPWLMCSLQSPLSAPRAQCLVPLKPESMVSISKLIRNIFRTGPHFSPSPEAEVPQQIRFPETLTQQVCREPSFTGINVNSLGL